nr:hypothetical protein [Pseudomonas aeruginosa]
MIRLDFFALPRIADIEVASTSCTKVDAHGLACIQDRLLGVAGVRHNCALPACAIEREPC